MMCQQLLQNQSVVVLGIAKLCPPCPSLELLPSPVVQTSRLPFQSLAETHGALPLFELSLCVVEAIDEGEGALLGSEGEGEMQFIGAGGSGLSAGDGDFQLEFLVPVAPAGNRDLEVLALPAATRGLGALQGPVGDEDLAAESGAGGGGESNVLAFSGEPHQPWQVLRAVDYCHGNCGRLHQLPLPGAYSCLHFAILRRTAFDCRNIDYFDKLALNFSRSSIKHKCNTSQMYMQRQISNTLRLLWRKIIIFYPKLLKYHRQSQILIPIPLILLPQAISLSHIGPIKSASIILIIASMKSCRVSICELRASEGVSQEGSRLRPTKYTIFMQQRSCLKHSSTPSCDSPLRLPPAPRPRDGECLLAGSTARDEFFVLLKGKNFFTHFQKPSKITRTEPAAPPTTHGLRPHLPGQKRQRQRRKELARTIEQDRLTRQESERKFLRRTLTVELALTAKNSHFL